MRIGADAGQVVSPCLRRRNRQRLRLPSPRPTVAAEGSAGAPPALCRPEAHAPPSDCAVTIASQCARMQTVNCGRREDQR